MDGGMVMLLLPSKKVEEISMVGNDEVMKHQEY